ncbi:AraC family transcriptional regulator [Melissococcus plutonius]|uniref:AraC family transcriptional regulator n=1 Tax=Melissococcus plutonius TaxID=33970 RepID=UPI003C309027
MKTMVLELLKKHNYPREWKKLAPEMRPKIISYVGKEPVYEFYHTLNDSLEINTHSVAVSVQPVESFIPYHMHNYVELTIPLVGERTIVTENEKIHVAQDEVIMIGKYTVHRVEPIDRQAVVVNLTLKGTAFSLNDFDFMYRKGSSQSISTMLFSLLFSDNFGEVRYTRINTHHDNKIMDILYDIIYEYYCPDIQTNQIIHFEILTLFSRLIRVASNEKVAVKMNDQPPTNLLTLLLYIEKHYSHITLEEMADYFNFNPNYLSAYLKKQTGLTFIKLVHLQRVNVAAEYLTYTNAPIEQISLKVGYENPSYFYKIFRKYLGVSPTDYRKQNSVD